MLLFINYAFFRLAFAVYICTITSICHYPHFNNLLYFWDNKKMYKKLINSINQDYYSLNAKYTKENANLKELLLLKE